MSNPVCRVAAGEAAAVCLSEFILLPLSKVAEFILSLDLRADWANNRANNDGGYSNISNCICS